MSPTVADTLWAMLHSAGGRRCYGLVGDALNPTMDALRRHGGIEFISVRHEEFGAFAAVADALLTGAPVAVCGTAGPGTAHLVNGLLDARKEGASVIAIAGDVETSVMDSDVRQELNPYSFFETSALYVGRLVNPAQTRAAGPQWPTPRRTRSGRRQRSREGRRSRSAAMAASRCSRWAT